MTIINNVMNKFCWYHLNLDVTNSIRKDFKPDWSNRSVYSFTKPTEVFNTEWLDYMKGHYLMIEAIMMFYKPAHLVGTLAHDDGKFRKFAINWLLSGSDSEMVWFDFAKTNPELHYTEAGTPYYPWPVTELTVIDRCSDNSKPTMVRVDNPHTINVGVEPRISISVRTRFNAEWQRSVDYLRSRNLLIERE